MGPTFRIATEAWEFGQIHRLNHETFTREIPQHPERADGILVDKRNEGNTYVIACLDRRIIGMVSFNAERPFSLDEKLPDLDAHLPPDIRVCEIRLLSVEPDHRNTRVFSGLIDCLATFLERLGYGAAVISGTVRQKRLYERMGFVPFGPRVGTPQALYQPMILMAADWHRRRSAPATEPISLLPGPVRIHPEIRDAFQAPPISHRSERFIREFELTRLLLRRLVRARHANILMGSGTLANDAIAAQLSLHKEKGLSLTNGEFGDRLVNHARRFGLDHKVVRLPYGEAFGRAQLERALDCDVGWVWAVHCETSTGVLNDLEALKQLCTARDIRLCVDCISSIGQVPLDLSGVHLASGVSGKALGSFTGLSMVFHDREIEPRPDALPRYLDLGVYAAQPGGPYTNSSNLVMALQRALLRIEENPPFARRASLSSDIRSRLREAGWRVVGTDESAAPGVITIELPPEVDSASVGDRLERRGYLLSYRSGYLLKRNWIQICLMGECDAALIEPLYALLEECAGLVSESSSQQGD